MNKIWSIMLIGAMVAGVATVAEGKREDKNEPKKKLVEETLKALGEDHFPERMKVRSLGSVKTENTYYHIFVGALKGGYSYRAIVYNNKQVYLGYYEIEQYEPSGYEDGAILVDIGGSEPEKIRIKDTGPVDNTRIDGVGIKFIKGPVVEEKKVVATDETADESTEPEFRRWVISVSGKRYPVRAIYVSQDFGTVTIRAEASGREKAFPKSSLSDADKAYVRKMDKK